MRRVFLYARTLTHMMLCYRQVNQPLLQNCNPESKFLLSECICNLITWFYYSWLQLHYLVACVFLSRLIIWSDYGTVSGQYSSKVQIPQQCTVVTFFCTVIIISWYIVLTCSWIWSVWSNKSGVHFFRSRCWTSTCFVLSLCVDSVVLELILYFTAAI